MGWVMMMRIRPAVVHRPAMKLVIIMTLKPVRTLKRPAITLPVTKSVNQAAILTVMLVPRWINYPALDSAETVTTSTTNDPQP